ncbi:MAG: outer membrane protein OmpA-like peptidoglycan-associated protein [Methylophagaceae bacterium]|jgi:outer membrane protein OmpA-like peptidoglycan-associated protein
MLIKLLNCFTLLSLSLVVQAEQFQAPLTDTHWQVTETPLMCTLSQDIAGFGEAKFQRQSGSQLNLIFTTKYYPAAQSNVNFEIAEAPWQNVEQRLMMTAVPSDIGQTEFVLSGPLAKQALTQIQQGRFPALRYNSQNIPEEISVLLSSVHLTDSMPAFQQCLKNLLPYSFASISKLTVYFSSEKAALTSQAQQALIKLADYVKLDSSVKRITISGHTDNHGKRQLNVPLSVSRATVIKNFLVKDCEVPESLITTSSHIEWKPISTNKSASGRALNRRAEIEVFR